MVAVSTRRAMLLIGFLGGPCHVTRNQNSAARISALSFHWVLHVIDYRISTLVPRIPEVQTRNGTKSGIGLLMREKQTTSAVK